MKNGENHSGKKNPTRNQSWIKDAPGSKKIGSKAPNTLVGPDQKKRRKGKKFQQQNLEHPFYRSVKEKRKEKSGKENGNQEITL